MYIRTNDEGVIKEYITVGQHPDRPNWYEVDTESIPDEIRNDMFSYKYIDGEFILRDDILEKKLNKVKEVKIEMMSSHCKISIKRGFDHTDGHHYSLEESDQLKLQNLALKAMQGRQVSWKYDDGLCQFYSPEEMILLSEHAEKHITYHQTYFNQLKHQISLMTSIDDVVAVSYGMDLDKDHSDNLEKHTIDSYVPGESELGKDLVDRTDYDFILKNSYL